MKDDYKQVLIKLVTLSKNESSGKVKSSDLAKATKSDDLQLKNYLQSLQRANYITIEKTKKSSVLIVPTLQGIEKADLWERELKGKSFPGRLHSIAKWLGAGLATGLLGLVLWYFGFSPDTIGLQPFDARIPIRVYDVGTYPTTEPNYGWYAFSPQELSSLSIDGNTNIFGKAEMRSFLGDYIPATWNGEVTFKFAIENVATRYQADIQSVDVIVQQRDVKNIEDIYVIPTWGLGGAEVREFVVTVSPDSGKPLEDGSRIHNATLLSNETPVDYVYVEPGKRETISIIVKLENAARYTLIPVITYLFRDKTKTLRMTPYSIVYPELYRTWGIYPASNVQNYELETSHLVVNNFTGEIQRENSDLSKTKACLPEKKWIFFTSTMVQWGVIHQAFVIDSNGENLRLLDSHYGDPRNELSIAWTNNGLVRLRFDDGEKELFDPASGEKLNWTEEIEQQVIGRSERSKTDTSAFITSDGKWVVHADKQLSISSTDSSCLQNILTPGFGEIWNVSLQP